MKKILLVGLLFVPLISNAQIIEKDDGWYLLKDFRLPSGIIYSALELIQLKEPQNIEDNIRYWAEKMGLDPDLMVDVARCESGEKMNIYAVGDWRSEESRYMAFGLFQWWESSWNYYIKIYNENWKRDNWKHQVKLTMLVIKDGGWRNWYNCYRLASR